MIKSELINQISYKMQHIPENSIEKSVNVIIGMMSDALSNGTRIEVRGFGSFSLHYKAARSSHNPRTGTKVVTKPKYSPYFKVGKDLRHRVNQSKENVPINNPDA